VRNLASIALALGLAARAAGADPAAGSTGSTSSTYTSELRSDLRWAVNNLEADGEDILTSPLHVGELLTKPSFYWTTLGAGAALGGSFALDRRVRTHVQRIDDSDAHNLEAAGNIALWSATALLYGYGLQSDDPRARRYMLTSVFSAGVSGLLATASKAAFGRERPKQNDGPFAFFRGGHSFVSSAATPAFSLAAGISEYADNRWYVALPAYGAAAAVGLGRMGKDAHWLSDIVGSALIGAGTTELFLYLHNQHDAHPERYRVFPLVMDGGVGMGIAFEF
jgi:membrane-associated phospholipid phosphatase